MRTAKNAGIDYKIIKFICFATQEKHSRTSKKTELKHEKKKKFLMRI